MDLLKRVLFCLVLVGLISGEVLRIDAGQSIAMTLLDVAVNLFVGISLAIQMFQKRKISFGIEKYALYFVGLGALSLALQITHLSWYQIFVSFLYAIRFVLYSVGVSIAVQSMDERWKKKIPLILFSSGVLLAVLGFVQYVYYPSLRNLYYAGWDVHLYRLFATFLDPNFMGLFFVLNILLGVALFLDAKKRNPKIIIGTGIFIVSAALLLTYSRGAFVAGALGMGILLWRMGYKKFISIFVGVVIVCVVVLELFGPKSEGTKLLRTASIKDRVISMQTVSVIIQKNVFIGVGFDAYRYAQEKEGFLKTNIDTTHSGAGTDNSFLLVWATTGIVGLGLYLTTTYKLLAIASKSNTITNISLLSGYWALIIGSFFVNALFYPFLLVWIWILVGVIVRRRQ